jgi:hypothetical protein
MLELERKKISEKKNKPNIRDNNKMKEEKMRK